MISKVGIIGAGSMGDALWDSVYSNYNEHYTFLNLCYKEICS